MKIRAEERIKLAEETIAKAKENLRKVNTIPEVVKNLLKDAERRFELSKELFKKGNYHAAFYEGHVALRSAKDALDRLESS